MKMIKKHTVLKKMSKQEESFVDASPEERVEFIWDLTAEIWSLKDRESVKRRLQRDITHFSRQ